MSSTKGQLQGKKPNVKSAGYTERFDQAPESLEEEDDDEDVGRPINLEKGSNLAYDSDEDKESNELMNMENRVRDRTNTAAEKVPKLSKP